MNKSFMYVAAIALLTAGTAFAQSGASGVNGSTINNSTPTPAAKGAAEGAPRTSAPSGSMMNQSGSMMKHSGSGSSSMGSGSDMNQSRDMDHSGSKSKSASKARMHHMASNRAAGNDSKEDQETMKLNRQQLASGAGGMNGSSNSFDKGSPQQAQAGGANCTPDNMSCGTARDNPAINSSPQQRTYGNQH